MKRYFARDGENTVLSVLRRAGVSETAVLEGRVFAGKNRVAELAEAVAAGEEIVVQPEASPVSGVAILAESHDLYAVSKPAGLSTEPDRRGGASLLAHVSELLSAPVSALHAATRLDTMVSGIVIVARGHDASTRVARLKTERKLRRRYVAVGAGTVSETAGTWSVPVGTGPRGRPVARGKDARAATTHFRSLWSGKTAAGPVTALSFEPVTGRPHQLRIHSAEAGAPLFGDVQRGAPSKVVLSDGSVVSVGRVMLHAGRVEARFPSGPWSVTLAPPEELTRFLAALGGDSGVFSAALAAPFLYEGHAP